MKYIIVFVLLLAVVMAAKPDKAARKAAKKMFKKCRPFTFSYTKCTDGMMSVTRVSSNEGCEQYSETNDVECVHNKTKSMKKDPSCMKTQTIDRTNCGEGNIAETSYTITLVRSGCKKNNDQPMPYTVSCLTGEKEGTQAGGKGKWKKGNKGNKKGMRKNRKDRKMRKERRNKKKKIDCKYGQGGNWSDCDPVTNMKKREHPRKRGDPSSCEPVKVVEKLCKRKKKPTGCKYRMSQWSECDGTTNIKTMVKTLKRGDPNTCPSTQVIEKICKRQHKGLKTNCKYKKTGRWGACDQTSGFRSREVILKKGDPKFCQPTKTVTKPCRKTKNKKKLKGKGCIYDKQPWGPCDAATNTVSRTLTLKDGDRTRCNVTKLQTKKCKNKHLRPHVCKYRRTSWEDCDPSTNMRVMIKTLKRGDPAHCEATQQIKRKCKGKKKDNMCKYKYEDWSDCDLSTNTMTRRQVLKSGPASCQQFKEYSKRCKKPCKFENGNWTECDSETHQMKRVDILKKAADPSCPKTRILTKKCGKNGQAQKCVYDRGIWSDCEATDNPVRTRTQKLATGGPNCEAEKITTKSCTKKNGEVRCFYGPWSEYDECMNGVQKKRRQVVQGGQECEIKSIQMKPC